MATKESSSIEAEASGAEAIRKRLVDALGQYLQSLQEMQRGQADNVNSIYQEYFRTLIESRRDASDPMTLQNVYHDQTKRLLEHVGEAGGKSVEDLRSAYDEYLKSIAGVLAGATANSLPPSLLAGLGQHLVAVAYWGAALEAARCADGAV